MRLVGLTLCLVMGFATGNLPNPAAAQSKFFSFERNTDRPGRDYSNTASPGAIECSFACQAENRCRAWTFVKARIQGPWGHCFFDPAPPARRNNCCTSGLQKGNPGRSRLSYVLPGGADTSLKLGLLPQRLTPRHLDLADNPQ